MIYLYIGLGAAILIAALIVFIKYYMNLLVERRVAAYQNNLVAKHCSEVENIYKQMRGWRHDYHNHIQAMLALIDTESESSVPLQDYLLHLNDDLTSVDTIIKTGNVMVDAILNSKISLAQTKKITVNAKAAVPKELPISAVDLCVIIGNLLDNAIEACAAVPSPWIRVYIGIHKEFFYISISNPMDGEVKKSGLRYLSTKTSPSHGFGLVRIDKISDKYGGFVDRQNEPGVFATEVMLPFTYES